MFIQSFCCTKRCNTRINCLVAADLSAGVTALLWGRTYLKPPYLGFRKNNLGIWFSLNQSRKICNILFFMDSEDTFIQFPHKLNLLNLARVAECSTTQSMEYPSCKGPCRGQQVDPNILLLGFWSTFCGDGTSALTVLGVIVWRIHSRVSNLGIELAAENKLLDGLDSIYLFPHSLRATEGGILGYCTFWEKTWLNLQVCLYQPSPGIRRRLAQKSTHHNLCLLCSPQEEYQKQSRTSKGFPKWAEQKWAERLLVVQTFDIDIITSRILLKYRNFDRLQRFQISSTPEPIRLPKMGEWTSPWQKAQKNWLSHCGYKPTCPPMSKPYNGKSISDRNHMGLSENSVPLNPMVNDHYPY